MSGFDVIAGSVLLLSGVVGFTRGATREVTSLVAFLLAAEIALFGLRYSAPIVERFIHAPWAAKMASLLVVFLLAYIGLRTVGGTLIRGVRRLGLSSLDRALGAAVGFARGVVVLGVGALVIEAALPAANLPGWIADARLFPLARASGAALLTVAPRDWKRRAGETPLFRRLVTDAPVAAESAPPRRGLGVLVETAR